jgi:L-fucose isomerase-like protein
MQNKDSKMHTRYIDKETTFGVIVATRGIFNPEHAKQGRKDIVAKLEELNFPYVILPESATKHAAVETLEDAKKCAALFRESGDKIDGILVINPNFGDEQGVAEAIDRSGLRVPVMVVALPDDPKKVGVKERRDAFCGKISIANNFYQYGIDFTNTRLFTESLSSAEFAQDLEHFAGVCRVVGGIRQARIGLIGARPEPFHTVRFSERLLQATGIKTVTVDLSEIISGAAKRDENDAAVKALLGEIREYGRIPNSIVEKNVVKQACLSAEINEWMDANEVDASAIQCWSSIQNNYGCATCLSMSMMGERLMPSACEVDVAGVVSMYTLALATKRSPGFLDWNNNVGEDPNLVACVHCSNYPKSFFGEDGEIEISNLDVLGMNLGAERCFGAIKGRVQSGDLTYFRMSTDDINGRIHSYVGEGEFTDDPFPMDGGVAVARLPEMQRFFRWMTKAGFEHHVAMVRGRAARSIHEAVTTYLKWDDYWHVPDESVL